MKHLWTLLFLTGFLFCNGQDIILQKNNHPRVLDLKHSLNTTKDSLLLKSKTTIVQAEIFNEDYEHMIQINAAQTAISLADLPPGTFVVEVQLSDKIVIMHLFKPERKTNYPNLATSSVNANSTNNDKGKENYNEASRRQSIEFLLSGRRLPSKGEKDQKLFWVQTKVDTGNTSSKTMRFANQNTVNKMITKHELETKTLNARLNELIVWEIYDQQNFMRHQMVNPNYVYSNSSEYFSVVPFYSSKTTIR